MNGRIYDPLLGRFLSADTFIQAPMNLQSYNRYSYVLNNPLSLIDPTGFLVTVTGEKDKDGNIRIKITYTAKLVNESSTKLDAKKLEGIKTKLTDAIQKAWAGSMEGKSGAKIEWSTEAKIEVVDSASKASKDDHIITIKDSKDMPDAKNEKTGEMGKPDGVVDTTGKNIRNMFLNSDLTRWGRSGDLKDTGAHEFGHQLGLDHPNPDWREDKNPQLRGLWENNLMYQGQQDGSSNVFQVQKAINNFENGRLNPWLTKAEEQKKPEKSAVPPQSKDKEEEKR